MSEPPAPLLPAPPDRRPSRTPRAGRTVELRPLEPETDAEPLHRVSHGGAERVWTYMPYGPFADAAAMRAWLGECAASTDPDFRAVVERARGEPAGMVSYLNIVPAHRRLEVGHIWYAPHLQRSAANTEAVYLMMAEAFERLGFRRVEWKCDARNTRSRRAALRLGLSFEGVFRNHMIVKGANRDTAWYAITDDTWPAVKANMERWLYGGEDGLSLTALNAPLVAATGDPAANERHWNRE